MVLMSSTPSFRWYALVCAGMWWHASFSVTAFKVAVITSPVVKIIFAMAEITFKVAVITSSVAKINFVLAEITFKVAVM